MNLPSNLGKSILLAMCIFWIINFTEDFEPSILPFILLSIIPIGICVTLVIIITICPFFWALQKENESNRSLARRCFPYYLIISFSLCAFGIIVSDFEIYFISFFITAFLTSAQSWVWFAKEK